MLIVKYIIPNIKISFILPSLLMRDDKFQILIKNESNEKNILKKIIIKD